MTALCWDFDEMRIRLAHIGRLLTAALALLGCSMGHAQDLNLSADSIVGTYVSERDGEKFKVRVTRKDDGSYRGQIVWVRDPYDSAGAKRLDERNPDRNLRSVECDRIVLFDGLRYNSLRRQWDSARIYDPLRGITAAMTASFEKDGRLRIRGSVGPVSGTAFWTREP